VFLGLRIEIRKQVQFHAFGNLEMRLGYLSEEFRKLHGQIKKRTNARNKRLHKRLTALAEADQKENGGQQLGRLQKNIFWFLFTDETVSVFRLTD
jgi:hypothetical protein